MCLPGLRLSAGGLRTRHRAIEALSTRVPVRRLRLASVTVYSPWQRRRQKRTEEGRRPMRRILGRLRGDPARVATPSLQ